jgi:hypothetical protein
MRFSKHILAAACLVLLGTACNTTPVADDTLSVEEPGCILPEVESMETPQTSKPKANTGEGEIQDEAGCILPEAK